MRDDIKTKGIVLRRTNYGEADRILNIITPEGKISAIAKGVRKEKSRLAGGVEMMTLSEYNIHRGKSDMGVVTSAKMMRYYDKIVKDYNKMTLAGRILKKINNASEGTAKEFFELAKESLEGLNSGVRPEVVEAWFDLNLLKCVGEEINLHRDERGELLVATERYDWNRMEKAFVVSASGQYGVNEIKLMRAMVSMGLIMVSRVKGIDEMLPSVTQLIESVIK